MLTPLRKSLREMVRLMPDANALARLVGTESRWSLMMFQSADCVVGCETLGGHEAAASQDADLRSDTEVVRNSDT